MELSTEEEGSESQKTTLEKVKRGTRKKNGGERKEV